jgi:hypothetical protein
MTIRLPLATRAATAIVLVMLTAGCGDSTPSSAGSVTTGAGSAEVAGSPGGVSQTDSAGPAGSGSAGPGSTDSGSAGAASTEGSQQPGGAPSAADSSPPQEGAGPESPRPQTKSGPTVPIASLPIGGSPDVEGARQCGQVNLLGVDQLPPGISISVDSIALNPPGIFDFGGDLCGSAPPCTTSWTWTTETASKTCAVAVTQVADASKSVTLELSSTVSCPDQNTCELARRVLRAGGGSQLLSTAVPGVVGSSSPAAGESGSSDPGSTSSPSATASPSDSASYSSSPSASAGTSAEGS